MTEFRVAPPTVRNRAGDDEASRLSRRQFIKRVIASGAVASAATYVFGGLQGCSSRGTVGAALAGSVERLVRINVNGQLRSVDVLPQETLAMTLRYRLNLPGTKLSCDRDECGACSVLIDDVLHNSCSVLTHSVRTRKVVTVEGVGGPNGELHPVQQAFIDELSPQCGFCTPGQVIAAVALLKQNPNPTREEARHGMAGNLCRCGAYDNYLNGVMRAAASMKATAT
jgi:aerobic-type carbon monoxide dehydrogenase small subunit (CoxS/CutS family)